MSKVSEDIYYKLITKKIDFKIFSSCVKKSEQGRDLIARLYLVNCGKGTLYYYPENRGRYCIEDRFGKLEFYSEKA